MTTTATPHADHAYQIPADLDGIRDDAEGFLIQEAQELASAGEHHRIGPDHIDALISELRTLSYLHYQRDMAEGYGATADCPF
jgi:hypothetical protein